MAGAVFRPKDLAKGRKKIIENALNDINPYTKDEVINLLSSWQGIASEQKLGEMLGQERARSLLDGVARKKQVR
jgi:hypothetical protein